MLELKDVSLRYGGALTALRNVNLKVPLGGIVSLLGANGAGKTTILRAISGNLSRHSARISSGQILLNGEDVTALSMSKRVKLGVVQVPEGRRIFGKLTVDENLQVGGVTNRNRQAKAKIRRRIFELFPVLEERQSQAGLLLSGGEQQMLAIGRALMAAPRLLMLDEPSLGLAPKVVERIGEVLTQINHDDNVSLLLIEQNANMALSVSDYAYVLELGKVSLEGPSEQLMESDQVQHLYLGHGPGTATDTITVRTLPEPLTPWRPQA